MESSSPVILSTDKPRIGQERGVPIHLQNPGQEKAIESFNLIYGNLFDLVHLLTQGVLEKGFNNTKRSPRKRLIDRLNFLNFSEREMILVFRHPKYNEIITRVLKPQPCREETVSGLWMSPEDYSESLKDFEVLCFLIENRREFSLAQTQRTKIRDQGIELSLPEFGFEIILRKADRYPCPNIQVQLMQSGIFFSGRLDVFSVKSFRVEIFPSEGISLKWINSEYPVQIVFNNQGEVFYSRECNIIKQKENPYSKTLVLQPSNEPIHRFKRREFRAPRQTLHPSPGIYYVPPLIKKLIKLTICE